MQDIPVMELPEAAKGRLADLVEFAREAASYRVGFEVELASIEPFEREGHTDLCLSWRAKLSETTALAA